MTQPKMIPCADEKILLLQVKVRARKNWRPAWDDEHGGPVLVQHQPTCADDCPGGEDHAIEAWMHADVVGDIEAQLLGSRCADSYYVRSVRQAVAP